MKAKSPRSCSQVGSSRATAHGIFHRV